MHASGNGDASCKWEQVKEVFKEVLDKKLAEYAKPGAAKEEEAAKGDDAAALKAAEEAKARQAATEAM